MNLSNAILWRFIRIYGQRYLPWYAAGAVALAATNALSVTIPLYLARGIDALAAGPQQHDTVSEAIVAVAGMGVAVILIRTASRVLFFNPGRLIEAELMRDLFASVLRQQPDFFAKMTAGDLTSRFTADVQVVRLLFGFTALGMVNTIAVTVLAGVQLMRLSPALGLLAGVPLALAFAGANRAVGHMRRFMKENQELLGQLSEQVLASFQGIAAIHAFGAAGAMGDRFRVTNRALERNAIARSGLRIAVGPLLGLAAAIDGFLVLWIGGHSAISASGVEASFTPGEIVAFLTLVALLATSVRGFTFTLTIIRQAGVSLERLDAVLTAEPSRPDQQSPQPLRAPISPPRLSAVSLSYRYPNGDRPALSNVSFDVPAAGVLGIFGPTGSGKTTLVRCLLRLCDPPPGTLFVNGIDVRLIDLDLWRTSATLVPQRAFLWSGSVRDNIMLGQSGERAMALLETLIDEAQLRVDVNALPHGIDTVVGEAGITLSGGQRQRVALARGLAREATVFVLDDVLSAVDHATEAALSNTLARRASTTVIVSNRISALRRADIIIVLDAGVLVDAGTHDELFLRDGIYRQAAILQQEEPSLGSSHGNEQRHG